MVASPGPLEVSQRSQESWVPAREGFVSVLSHLWLKNRSIVESMENRLCEIE